MDIQRTIQDAIAAAMGPLNDKLDQVTRKLTDMETDQVHSSEKARIIKEGKDKAAADIRANLEANNISFRPEDLEFDTSRSSDKMKKEDLDEFDGSDLFSFKASVDSALSIFETGTVARMMARNLTGRAHTWWVSLDSTIRDGLLVDSDVFLSKLEDEFAENQGILRERARNRRWSVLNKPVLTYFYDKYKLVSNSFGRTLQASEVCHEIREGLPDDFKVLVRTPLSKTVKVEALRQELALLETDYVSMVRRNLRGNNRRNVSATPQPMTNTDSSSNRTAPRQIKRESSARPRSLRDTYNPGNIEYGPDPSNPQKRVRIYTIPDGSGRKIYCNRPCSTCGADHFNFEHPQSGNTMKGDNEAYPLQNVGDGNFNFSINDSMLDQREFSGYPSQFSGYPSPDSGSERYPASSSSDSPTFYPTTSHTTYAFPSSCYSYPSHVEEEDYPSAEAECSAYQQKLLGFQGN